MPDQATLTKQTTDTALDVQSQNKRDWPGTVRPDHTDQTDQRHQLNILTLITLNGLAPPDQATLTKQTTDTSSRH